MRQPDMNVLSCSFCHKSQDSVSKLISSPSDYPRAYIVMSASLFALAFCKTTASGLRPSQGRP